MVCAGYNFQRYVIYPFDGRGLVDRVVGEAPYTPLIGKSVIDCGLYISSIIRGVVVAPFIAILFVIFLILSLREKVKYNDDIIKIK